MIRRLLLLAIVGYFLFVWVRRLVRGVAPREGSGDRPEAAGGQAAPHGGRMVRDRICDTFVPRDRALQLADGSGEHFFCSEECRQAHLARSAPRAS